MTADELFTRGLHYYQGDGLARDFSKAFECFQASADKGHRDAQCWLGLCYYRGDGTPKEARLAFAQFQKAASAGHSNAQYYLGSLYLRGEGTPKKDLEQAVIWLKKAEEGGHPEARRELDTIWNSPSSLPQPKTVEGSGFFGRVGDKLSAVTGLQPLAGFNLRDLFSELFRKRDPEEIEEQFAVGTRQTTPDFYQVQTQWPKPWVFGPILMLSVAVYFGFSYAFSRFQNFNLIPGWIFIGSFGAPVATLIMIYELNILKNISAYLMAKLFLVGGILSLVFSLLFFEQTKLNNSLGAIGAGPVEETGKLLAVILVARSTRYPWTINGIVLGAAVGAAFSAFESAGYAFNSLLGLMGERTSMERVMMTRAILSPFGHICCITAGALWRIMAGRKFEFSFLTEGSFLRIALIPVGLHMLWNAGLSLPFVGEPWGSFGVLGLISVLGWMLLFMLIQDGINQIKTAQGGQPTRR